MLFVSKSAAWKGPTNSLLLILKHLRERLDASVLLCGSDEFLGELDRENVPYFSFDSLNKYAIPSILRLIRGRRFDVVYGNSTSGSSRNALIASKLAGVPFICHVREMARPRCWRKFGFLRYADAIIAVSEAAARSVSPYTGRCKVHVIHNGVDVASCNGDREGARERLLGELGLARESTLLLSVGYLSERKGQEYAIEVMDSVRKLDASVHLVLVGAPDIEPEFAKRVQDRIRAAGLSGCVHLLGFRRDVPSLLRAADVYVHTAVSDPHPRAVLEAMAAGLPVVAFAVDGIVETVVHAETGYLVPPCATEQLADSVSILTRNGGLRVRYGEAGRQRVCEKFDAQVTAQAVDSVIDGVLVGSRIAV